MKRFSALEKISSLAVQQQKEWGEIMTGFETRNRYLISDGATGEHLFTAAEEARSMLARWFLKALRPFTIHVFGDDNQELLRIDRPFRFYFHQVEVRDVDGALLGTVERQFALLRRIYVVRDAEGREACRLFGPILHPWTFRILAEGEREIGKITKRWSGLLKESMTDADNFGVELPAELDPMTKAVFLGAVFLVDFVHFEGKQ